MVEPCSICELWMADSQCDNTLCPVKQMKDENKRLKAENRKLKQKISKTESDNGWDFENSLRDRTYEMGQC